MFLVERDGTECERKSGDEGGKPNHKTLELTWIVFNMSASVLPRKLDITRIGLVLQWLDTLMTLKVNWQEQVKFTRIQTLPFAKRISESNVCALLTATEADMNQELKRVTHILQKRAQDSVIKTQTTIGKFCGLLGSVLLVREINDIIVLELVKKSMTATHCFELKNRVWEPGIVAYVGEWKEFEELSNGVLDGYLSDFLSKLVAVSKGARIIKLRRRHYLTSVSAFTVVVRFHLTYVMLHSPRPPELLGIADKPETFGSLVDWEEYQTGNESPRPQQFLKLFTGAKVTKAASSFRFTADWKLFLTTGTRLACIEVPISQQEEMSVSIFNLEDKVDFKGGGIVTYAHTAVHGCYLIHVNISLCIINTSREEARGEEGFTQSV